MISVWVPVAHHFQIAALAHWYGGSAWCLSLSIPYLSAGCFAAHPNIGILSHCNPTARLLFQCTSQGCKCGASQLVQEHQWHHIPCPSFLQLLKKKLDHTHTEWDIGGSYGLILLNHPPPIPLSVWFSQTSSVVLFSALDCLADGSHHSLTLGAVLLSAHGHTPGPYVLSLSQAGHTFPDPF